MFTFTILKNFDIIKCMENNKDIIYKLLEEHIKNPVSELNYTNNFELLIAVVLSAQCTDKRVNIVTSKLFKIYNTPNDFAVLSNKELEELIRPTGFFRNKADNIIKASKMILEKYNGQVPDNYDDLIQLAGVGRKTANVILAVAYNKPAIGVDTHVFRVTNRLGIVKANNVLDTEKQLMKIYHKSKWNKINHYFVLFGRYICKAKNPDCETCYLKDYCKYYKKNIKTKGK